MDCFPELQILICAFSQTNLNPKRKSQKWDFLFDCLLRSIRLVLCDPRAVSPKSVIPSGAKFESGTSYLRSMRFLNFMRYANPFESSEPKEVAAHSSLFS